MEESRFTVVLPGDKLVLRDLASSSGNDHCDNIKIGPGLKIAGGSKVLASRCGLLRGSVHGQYYSDSSAANWLDYRQKRYVPILNDTVVGQIVQKTADSYKLDIGWADLASLSALNFEGATKRNKPNIRIGDLILGRVSQIVEPELTCLGKSGVSRCLGVLPDGGYLTRQNLNVPRKLLSESFPLLDELGEEISFEMCIGANGWLWIKGCSVKETVAVVRAVEASDRLTVDLVKPFVKRLIEQLRSTE